MAEETKGARDIFDRMRETEPGETICLGYKEVACVLETVEYLRQVASKYCEIARKNNERG